MLARQINHLIFFTSAFCCFSVSDGLLFSDVYWSTAIKLAEYQGYRSVSLLSYEIPAQATRAIFTFQAKTSSSSCASREVHVYFQHGSYPLVTPLNETFPPDFYLNRTDAFHVKIKQDTDAVSYVMPMPRPGRWYFAAFLPKTSDSIQQKGLGKSCMYGMVVVVESQGFDYIPDISVQDVHRVKLSLADMANNQLYRFQLPKDTVQYTVTVNNCHVKYLNQKPKTQTKRDVLNKDVVLDVRDSYENVTYSVETLEETVVENVSTSDLKRVVLTTNPPKQYVETSTLSSMSISSANSTTQPLHPNTTSSEPETTTLPPPRKTTTTGPDPSACPVVTFIQPSFLPFNNSVRMEECGSSDECTVKILSPNVEDWTYISMEIDNHYNVSEITFDLQFNVKECESLKFLLPKMIVRRIQQEPEDFNLGPHQGSCVKTASLGRFDWAEATFNMSYVLSNQAMIPAPEPLVKIPVQDFIVMVTNFLVEEPTDLGGTMIIEGSLDLEHFDVKSQSVVVYLCFMKGALPGGRTVRSCKTGIQVLLNTTVPSHTLYVPYPEAGMWYLGMNSKCLDNDSHIAVKCSSLPEVSLRLGISGCVDGQCGEYGECVNYISGVHVFSSCKCFAGWQGYGCTDGRNSRSRGEELLAVLLLTLSNLFFIPSAVLALYRRYFVEAAIYVFTMFLSTFYHACDTSDLVYFCLLRYDILSFADFLASISSFWVTMLVMAKLPRQVRGFAQTVGAVCIAVGVEYDRHGLLVFAIPAGLAAVVMFGSWIFQCGRKKYLYPPKRYLLAHLLPGVILAVVGLVLFAFLETDENYKYTHSCWHVAMSLSIVFLLPPRQIKGINLDGNSSSSTDTNADTNTSTRIVLSSYSGTIGNGHVMNNDSLAMGDNPAYIAVE